MKLQKEEDYLAARATESVETNARLAASMAPDSDEPPCMPAPSDLQPPPGSTVGYNPGARGNRFAVLDPHLRIAARYPSSSRPPQRKPPAPATDVPRETFLLEAVAAGPNTAVRAHQEAEPAATHYRCALREGGNLQSGV